MFGVVSARLLRASVGSTEVTSDQSTSVSSDRRALRWEASYESCVVEAIGNLPSSPAYLSPAFLKAEPSSMNFRC